MVKKVDYGHPQPDDPQELSFFFLEVENEGFQKNFLIKNPTATEKTRITNMF